MTPNLTLKTQAPDPTTAQQILEHCYTKSEYARLIGKSPTWVNKLVEAGAVQELKINGANLIYAPQYPAKPQPPQEAEETTPLT